MYQSKDLLERADMKAVLGKLEEYDPSASNEGRAMKSANFGPKYSKNELEERESLKKELGKLDECGVIRGPVSGLIPAYEEVSVLIRNTSAVENGVPCVEIERPLTGFAFVVDDAQVARPERKAGKGSSYRPLGAVMKTLQTNYR